MKNDFPFTPFRISASYRLLVWGSRLLCLLLLSALLSLLVLTPGDVEKIRNVDRLHVSGSPQLDRLSFAIENHDAAALTRMLSNPRLALNVRDKEGMTPLLRACRMGWTDGARELLEHGAEAGMTDAWGKTGMH